MAREGARAQHGAHDGHGHDDGHDHGDDARMGDPRQMMVQLELVQRQMAKVDRQVAALEQAMMEAQQALATVRHIAESSAAQEVLLPIGSGVLVKARLEPTSQVILPLGAGYSTEAPAAKVAEALEERMKAIESNFREAMAESEELSQAYAGLNEALQGMQR